jgi:hypothetical protein
MVSSAKMERMMKVQEVILKAMAGSLKWWEVAWGFRPDYEALARTVSGAWLRRAIRSARRGTQSEASSPNGQNTRMQ